MQRDNPASVNTRLFKILCYSSIQDSYICEVLQNVPVLHQLLRFLIYTDLLIMHLGYNNLLKIVEI